MDTRGEHRFSSLMKQNKKAKIYAVFCFAGLFFLKIFCYEVIVKQKIYKRASNYYLRLLCLIANKQADAYFHALGYMPHKEEFCYRRSVSAINIGASQWCTYARNTLKGGELWSVFSAFEFFCSFRT